MEGHEKRNCYGMGEEGWGRRQFPFNVEFFFSLKCSLQSSGPNPDMHAVIFFLYFVITILTCFCCVGIH